MAYLHRGVEGLLDHVLSRHKVVVLEGGRSVGKTTLARRVAQNRGFATVFDLSDPGDRDALQADAHRVLATAARPILIDEAQLESELPVAVKRVVDTDDGMGQFLLTGSSRIGRGALGGSDPLVGRSVRIRLRSFTAGELTGRPVNVVEGWWSAPPEQAIYPVADLADLARRLVVGGLPPAALDSVGAAVEPGDVQRLLSAYVDGVLTVHLAGSRTDRDRLARSFRYLASNPGQILNLSRAASELSVRAETVRSHLDLCESAFLLDKAPAHRPTAHQTATAHPRVFASDVALASWAAQTSPEALVRTPRLLGSVLENLVANEVGAQASWSIDPSRLLHWRDSRLGREVDLVVERGDGSLLAIEVKSAATVSANDIKGLAAFADRAGSRFARGIVVYTGRFVTELADNIWAVPLAALG